MKYIYGIVILITLLIVSGCDGMVLSSSPSTYEADDSDTDETGVNTEESDDSDSDSSDTSTTSYNFTTITVGSSTLLPSTGNYAYYQVALTAGTTYYFYFVNSSSNYNILDMYTDAGLSYSTEVDLDYCNSNCMLSYNTRILTPTSTGTYYLKISTYGGATFYVSTSPAVNVTEFTELALDSSASINYTGSDRDYAFKAELEADTIYYLGTNSNTWTIEPYIYGPDYMRIYKNDVNANISGLPYLYYFTTEDAGIHYFIFDEYYSGAWGSYYTEDTVDLYLWKYKPNNALAYTLDTKADVSSGSATLKFTATAGTTYYVYSNDLSDFQFTYYESDDTGGSGYTHLDNQSACYYDTFTPDLTGELTILITSDALTSNSRITISESYPTTAQTTLTPDGATYTVVTNSSLDAYEMEHYKLECEAGSQYFIYTQGSAASLLTGTNGAGYGTFEKNDGSSQVICHRYYSSSSSYTKNITVFSYLATTTGSYTLVVDKDRDSDTLSSATSISADSFSGFDAKLSPNPDNTSYCDDEDCFYFTLTGGKAYTIETTGSVDTIGYLYKDSDTLVLQDTDSGTDKNFKISYTPSSNGTYFLMVDDENDSYGDYTVVITEGE